MNNDQPLDTTDAAVALARHLARQIIAFEAELRAAQPPLEVRLINDLVLRFTDTLLSTRGSLGLSNPFMVR